MTSVLQPGTVLAQRFELKSLAGQGAMGLVWEAFDREIQQDVAIKVLLPSGQRFDDAEERFRREAMVLMDLAHPAIVQILEYGVLPADEGFFLAMELMKGQTLRKLLQDRGSVEPRELVEIVRGICEALDATHRSGVVHRDVKPENLFLLDPESRDPAQPPAKLLDFGIAKVLWDSPMTGPGVSLGTLRYMSPEQLRAERELDGRADQYSLAVVLFEAVSGISPYPKDANLYGAILQHQVLPLRRVVRDASEALEVCLSRAMAAEPDSRYLTMSAFARAYAAACG